MKNKILGILVCTLIMSATVVSATGIMNISKINIDEKSLDSIPDEKEIIGKHLAINNPDDDTIQPADTKTGYTSIPAAAFTPESPDIEWKNTGNMVGATGGMLYTPYYLEEVREPLVNSVIFLYTDSHDTIDVTLYLYRNNMDGAISEMAKCKTSGSSGNGVSVDDTIDYAVIDNSQYSYYLSVDTSSNIFVYGVIIKYTYEEGGNSADGPISQQDQLLQDFFSR